MVGFLLAVNLLVFVLAFFSILRSASSWLLLAPVAPLGIDLVWFGVLLGDQYADFLFMHPPSGFALFYLVQRGASRGQEPRYLLGCVPFVLIQIVMIGIVLAFPGLVSAPRWKATIRQLRKSRARLPGNWTMRCSCWNNCRNSSMSRGNKLALLAGVAGGTGTAAGGIAAYRPLLMFYPQKRCNSLDGNG